MVIKTVMASILNQMENTKKVYLKIVYSKVDMLNGLMEMTTMRGNTSSLNTMEKESYNFILTSEVQISKKESF